MILQRRAKLQEDATCSTHLLL